MAMTTEKVLGKLQKIGKTKSGEPKSAADLGGALQTLAREVGRDHTIAQDLWRSGVREARFLAPLVEDPDYLTEVQMDRWVRDFDSVELCDLVCNKLFWRSGIAFRKAIEWAQRNHEELVKRAAFCLMTQLAAHDKEGGDTRFIRFLPLTWRASTDERESVRKAASAALRQVGRRNEELNAAALETAYRIRRSRSAVARAIAAEALRELRNPALQRRLRQKKAMPPKPSRIFARKSKMKHPPKEPSS
jgi:3-methyladenine DNA glycosylase AlkD